METFSDRVGLGKLLQEQAYPDLPRREILIDDLIKIDLIERERWAMPNKQAIKECVVLKLYRRGEISTGKVAELLGVSYRQFLHLLAKHKIPFLPLQPRRTGRRVEDI